MMIGFFRLRIRQESLVASSTGLPLPATSCRDSAHNNCQIKCRFIAHHFR